MQVKEYAMLKVSYAVPFFVAVLLSGASAYAQSAPATQPAATVTDKASAAPKDPAGAPSSLVVLFDEGSSTLRAQDKATLDRASRAYNEGKPIVMIVTGTSDRVGNPRMNLSLSQKRATAVLAALLDRGIPADRFQVLAKGETELPIPTKPGIAEARNRSVEISWR